MVVAERVLSSIYHMRGGISSAYQAVRSQRENARGDSER